MCACTCDSFRIAPQRCNIGILYDSSTAGVPQCYVRKCKVLCPPPPPNKGTSHLCEGSLKWREVSAWGKGFPLPWISIKKDKVQSALLHSPFLIRSHRKWQRQINILSLNVQLLHIPPKIPIIILIIAVSYLSLRTSRLRSSPLRLECEIIVVKTSHSITGETPSRARRWT